MTTTAIREKLYDLIKDADDKQLKSIYSLFEDQLAPKHDWLEDKEFVAELDERVMRYEAGIDRGHTWDELEASITERKKKRASK